MLSERGLLFVQGVGSEALHSFCGSHAIPGAKCPNCKIPLLRMLSLDLNDKALKKMFRPVPSGWLHLLYCWRCNWAQGDAYYKMGANGEVIVVRHKRGGVKDAFPYKNYPLAFPGCKGTLVRVDKARAELVKAVNDGVVKAWDLPESVEEWMRPHTQIGGDPFLVEGRAQPMKCPSCGKRMRLLATVSDETLDGKGFTGNEFVQVVFMLCDEEAIVGTYHAVD